MRRTSSADESESSDEDAARVFFFFFGQCPNWPYPDDITAERALARELRRRSR